MIIKRSGPSRDVRFGFQRTLGAVDMFLMCPVNVTWPTSPAVVLSL